MKKIGIVILATNAYFPLGIRFIKRFMHHYSGNSEVVFYFFSDENPSPYIPDNINVKYYDQTHNSWVDATNSKFKNICDIQYQLKKEVDYVYYFDADTNINKSFDESWFLGELVGGEHFGNRSFLSNGKGFDRNPIGKSYVPQDSKLPYTYYYGAFFGGKTDKVIEFCETLRKYQIIDQNIRYEPPVNDESYINKYFHYNPPNYTVLNENFMFAISDKGGIENTRKVSINVDELKLGLLVHKDKLIDIQFGKLVV